MSTRRWFGARVAFALALAGPAAWAAPADDGAYGRLDGDVDLSVAAGAGRDGDHAAASALARALYLGTAGPWLAVSTPLGGDGEAPRAVATGVELRPFFLPRLASDAERGPARLDLALDSLALDVGARFVGGPGRASSRALELALAFEVPLGADASGPWVGARAALDLAETGLSGDGSGARGAWFAFLAWHEVVLTHLVDPGDRLLR